VTVSARGAFGSVEVRTATEAVQDQARDEQRDQQKHHDD
jgi:hypothetical protein